MAKFKFQLEKILELRKYEQKQAEIELGKAVSAEAEIEEKIKQIAQQRITTSRLINNSTDFTALSSAQRFFTMLDVQKEYLLEQLTQAQLVTEEKREKMQDATQNSEALSKMRQKQNDEFSHEELQKEEDLIDDIVSSKGNNSSDR